MPWQLLLSCELILGAGPLQVKPVQRGTSQLGRQTLPLPSSRYRPPRSAPGRRWHIINNAPDPLNQPLPRLPSIP